jgi:predicted DCC family thiol-disulfide oxidoreductase YuxK
MRNTTPPTLTTATLVYDGECAFCLSCVQFIRRRTKKPLVTVPFQVADLAALGLTTRECADAVQWVSPTARASGHLAISRALRHARFPWPLAGVAIALPVVQRLAAAVYRRIANRRRCTAPTPPVV